MLVIREWNERAAGKFTLTTTKSFSFTRSEFSSKQQYSHETSDQKS